jgi:hypothetical protein
MCAVGTVHRMPEMSTSMLTECNAVLDINSHSRNHHSIAGKARKQSEGYSQGFESLSPKRMVGMVVVAILLIFGNVPGIRSIKLLTLFLTVSNFMLEKSNLRLELVMC